MDQIERVRTLSFANDTSFEPGKRITPFPIRRNRVYSFLSDTSNSHAVIFVRKHAYPLPENSLNRSRGFSFRSEISVNVTNESLEEEISDETKTQFIKRNYFKNIFACNIAFFLLFSSFVGLAIVQNSVNGTIGTIGLSVIYLVTVVSCMVISPLFIRFLGYKRSMVVCFTTFVMWESSNFYPIWGTVIPTAVFCGIGNGAVWSSQATYFSQQNLLYSKITKEDIEIIMARSFGIFFCFLLSGTSFGCLITSLILNLEFATVESSNITSPEGAKPECGSNFCPRGNVEIEQNAYLHPLVNFASFFNADALSTSKPDPFRVYVMVGIHVSFTVVAILILLWVVDDIYEDQSSEKPLLSQAWNSIKMCVKQLKRKRQCLMTPLNIYTGMSKSFMLADITQAYIGCALGLEMIGYASFTYGLVSCGAAIISGFVVRRTGRIPIYITAMVISVAMFIFLLLWIPDTRKTFIFFVIPSAWAVPDGIFISQMNSLYGCIFHDNPQGAFAAFRFWESIGLLLGYLFNSFICVKIKIYIMIVLLTFGIAGYFLTEYVQRKLDKRHNTLQASINHLTLSFCGEENGENIDGPTVGPMIPHCEIPTLQNYQLSTLFTVQNPRGLASSRTSNWHSTYVQNRPLHVFESNV